MTKSSPNSLMRGLDWLEGQIQSLIEGSLVRLFPGSLIQKRMAQRLVEAMYAGASTERDGRILAPNMYMILAAQETVDTLRQDKDLLDHLSNCLFDSGQETGFLFKGHPVIMVQAQAGLGSNEIQVQASHQAAEVEETAAFQVHFPGSAHRVPDQAFLIVDGMHVFPLTDAVINIGRAANNHLVIPDQRVAPQHAQIRAINGRFVVFEVGAAGSIQVNGRFAAQAVLQPGDVISLGGIPLVYGQEAPSTSDTQTYYPQGFPES